jgi:hypothetical protein
MVVSDVPVRNAWDHTDKQKGVRVEDLKYKYGAPTMLARIIADATSLMDGKYYAAYAIRNIPGQTSEVSHIK